MLAVKRIAAIRPHATTQAGPYALSYDTAGDLIRKLGAAVDHTLAWSAENKLTSVTIGAVTYSYYGADHSRVPSPSFRAVL